MPMLCPKCHAKQKIGAHFCHQCGWDFFTTSQPVPTSVNVPKKKKSNLPPIDRIIHIFFMTLIVLSIIGISLIIIGILFIR